MMKKMEDAEEAGIEEDGEAGDSIMNWGDDTCFPTGPHIAHNHSHKSYFPNPNLLPNSICTALFVNIKSLNSLCLYLLMLLLVTSHVAARGCLTVKDT